MWLMKDTPSLLTDMYELTMAQVYFERRLSETAHFEVTIRRLPDNWGFFVMAGLDEIESYLHEFQFSKTDVDFLRSTKRFSDDFLQYLAALKANVTMRAMPEGTVFFPNEPVLEVGGPLICAQLLESYILNILGFSIIEATLAARIVIAAQETPVVDFGLRRSQGPIASLRSARGAQMAGFSATSNIFAAKKLNFPPSGTMAHSFIHVHESQEQAFRNYAEAYGENAILLVDTYDCVEGIREAARVAKQIYEEKSVKIAGIRIDSGSLGELAHFARAHFTEQDVPFLKIFVSGDLDEFKIDDLRRRGAEIDGFGIGTNFAVSRFAPAVEIIYKIVQYDGKGVFKTSPGKETRPGRKMVTRVCNKYYLKDIVSTLQEETQADDELGHPPGARPLRDLLKPFKSAEQMPMIQQRLAAELDRLDGSFKAIRNPKQYPVELA